MGHNLSSVVRGLRFRVKRCIDPILHYGHNRYCPVCQCRSKAFLTAGVKGRADARCPRCGSLERHRLLLVFLNEQTNLFDGNEKKFLHVAPEHFFIDMFAKAAGSGYLTADLMAKNVMQKMDICDIQYPDNTFDVIYCSHVLEHVPDDRLAMREFYRTLKPGGWAVLNVPITAEKTFEDPSITDPAERLRLFGQDDHVRVYGPDYIDRLRESGFDVERITPEDLLSPAEIERLGLSNGAAGEVYYCRKS